MSSPVEQIQRVSETERRRRWRLLLGSAADDVTDEGHGDTGAGTEPEPESRLGSDAEDEADDQAGRGGDAGKQSGGTDGQHGLRGDDARIDAALGALYDNQGGQGDQRRPRSGSKRGGGLGRSKPGVVR